MENRYVNNKEVASVANLDATKWPIQSEARTTPIFVAVHIHRMDGQLCARTN